MEKAWSLALWCVLVCYNTGYRVGKLKGLPSRRKGIMNMARYHYTRENENGVVLYLESEPAEDAMDEFDDEIAVGFSGNGYLSFWTRCRRAAEALPNGLKYAAGGRCVITDTFGELFEETYIQGEIAIRSYDSTGTTIEHYLGNAEEFYPDEHPQILEREVGYIFPLMEVEPTICIELKDEG